MLRKFNYLMLLLLSIEALSQASVAIPFNDEINLDGELHEWKNSSKIILKPGLEGEERKGSFGEFDEKDLSIEINFSWDMEALYAGIIWVDDQWDVETIPYDSSRWGRMDRMYFYDGLVFRLLRQNYFYGAWIAPRESNSLQWDFHRLNDGDSVLSRKQLYAPEIASKRIDAQTFHIELSLSWKEIGLNPTRGSEFELRHIAPDSDCRGLSLQEKSDKKCLKCLAWTGKITLE